ncbi:cuticle protein 2-like [Pseudomyrmex gracilis]|uniref:cuticle protein 2-like n=1 Tax=Pseudomyrmex gracilis TaxID=219809 RepID=UPI000994B6E5|nr:cuticle protein 2-like [Pseudomyrmex gracilis]
MRLFIVFSAVLACAFAQPLVIYSKLVPAAPLGPDGRVVDTPEVALAKAEHAAAHINEKITLAQEAARSADYSHVIAYAAPAAVIGKTLVQPIATNLIPGAPIGPDGRVIDTPEVALAKAEHAAAHINDRIDHEAAKLVSQPVVVFNHEAPLLQYYLH